MYEYQYKYIFSFLYNYKFAYIIYCLMKQDENFNITKW